MIKILISAPSTKEKITDTRWVTAPLGCHYLASYLNNNGHKAVVWDINIDKESFEDTVKKGTWDIIAFSTQEATLEYDLSKIHLSKKLSPKSLLIAGGTGASLNYQEYFNHSPLDMVVQAEGEIPLLQLCNMLDKDGFDKSPLHTIKGLIIRNYAEFLTPEKHWEIRKCLNVRDMKQDLYWKETARLYENPDYNEINTFRLYTSNFCPMNCSFCTLTRLREYSCGKKGHPVIVLDASKVVHLIKKVLKVHKNCKQIFFVDDDFFIDKQRGIDFCKRIIELKKLAVIPKYLKFICLTNINRIDEDNIELIAKAGFRVLSIGVESTSQHVLDSLDKKQTVDWIWKTTKLILQHNIKPYYTLLMWTSFCTIADIVTDLRGFRKLAKMDAGLSIEPYLIPLKGTRLAEERVEERVRKVLIKGTNKFIYKGFAWLPMNKEVKPVFEYFEEIYPKYRKLMFDKNKGKHLEKNWQAKIILDCVEIALRKFNYIGQEEVENVTEVLDSIKDIKSCDVDIIGNVIEKE